MKLCFYSIFLALLVGCSQKEAQTKKYAVVSNFNETVLETDERERAYETAHNLTIMGSMMVRSFSPKPSYFVLEKRAPKE